MMKIFDVYGRFLRTLSDKSGSIAPLNLTGRLEDYLVLEFISHVYRETRGEILGIRNLGNRGKKGDGRKYEQKYDIAFIKSNSKEKDEIIGAFEAKYLTNAHKLREQEDATDNITPTIRSLSEQLSRNIAASHGGYPVNPEVIGTKVCGLVLASCRKAQPGKDEEKHGRFYDKILRKADSLNLVNYGPDKERPALNEIYNDVEVAALGRTYYLTLKVGLWQSSDSK